jgi:hypothetical protein
VLLYYYQESKTVYWADAAGNIARLEWGELKRWARCQLYGVEGFIDGDEPEFVNASLCSKCYQSTDDEMPAK